MTITRIQEEILNITRKAIENQLGKKAPKLKLGYPPRVDLGDFTVECFSLARLFSEAPEKIASQIAPLIEPNQTIEGVEAIGPYINFRIHRNVLFGEVCKQIISQGEEFASIKDAPQKVMVEYLSPNTNKPLHLGHLRNGALGMSIANLLEATGQKVIKAELVNDRGIHICKSMLAYQKWGQGETPETSGLKGDHFVGKWYVRYNQELKIHPEIEQEAQDVLRKWEEGDPDTIQRWRKMNTWVYQGFQETYKEFGLEFDKTYYESETYKLGKDIVVQGLKDNVFYKDEEGAVMFDLPPEEFGTDKHGKPKKVTLLRPDGTSVYITQDIGTAVKKVEEYNLDKSVYVVGAPQKYHFRCLFTILKALGYTWADNCYHLSYGMVYLPEGKMKSREGKVVDADDIIKEMKGLAAQEIQKRDPNNKLSQDEIKQRAAEIGVGAIKFYLLRVDPQKDIHFNPTESISFDGFTGPYCQYTYARACGILENAEQENLDAIDFSALGNKEELLLIQKLIQFPDEVKKAAEEFNPSRLVTHIYETAQTFNQFYDKHPVLSAETQTLKRARLVLVRATAIVLKKGLNLLGIEVLEKM